MKSLKKLNKSVFLLSGILLCLVACIYTGASDSEQVKEERPLVSAMTVSPDVPVNVPFCGEEVDLRRYNMREGYDREIASFTYFHSTTMLLFKSANRYFPVIEPILKANGVPDDFKYLAVIESHLNPRATSPAKAVGMWQLLEGTARDHGLTVTATVDERCDVEKSTIAACKYIKKAYEKYGNWIDVACSYNAGMGRISNELERQQTDRAVDLWLVEETTRYPYRILAIKQLFENPYKYGFVLKASNLYKPIECRTINVSADVADLASFAKEQGVTYADLKRFNPWLRDRKLATAGKTYAIQIPLEKEMYYTTPNTVVHNPAWVVR